VPRRVSLPGADELFRTTGGAALQPSTPRQHANGEASGPVPRVPAPAGEPGSPTAKAPPRSGEAAEADFGEHGRRQGEEKRPAEMRPPSSGRSAVGGPRKGPGAAAQGRAGPTARPASATSSVQAAPAPGQSRSRGRTASRRPSGRERHDEKITVYVSAEELMDLEHARLVLRGEHGLAVDRGRIVREAVAVVLADLESRGDASILVRRLRGR
jgi:hypothetical protein